MAEDSMASRDASRADEGFLTSDPDLTLEWARRRFGPENLARAAEYLQGLLSAAGDAVEHREAERVLLDLVRLLEAKSS